MSRKEKGKHLRRKLNKCIVYSGIDKLVNNLKRKKSKNLNKKEKKYKNYLPRT